MPTLVDGAQEALTFLKSLGGRLKQYWKERLKVALEKDNAQASIRKMDRLFNYDSANLQSEL